MTRVAAVQSWPALKNPCGGDALDRSGDVGVVEHDHGSLATKFEMQPLEAVRGRFGNFHPRPNGTGDAHHGRGVVNHHRPTRVTITVDHVEDTRRQELGGDLGHEGCGRGRGVARLEHDGVAGGEGRSELPHSHHHRIVPRRDLGADPDRFAPDEAGHPAHVLGSCLALEMSGGSCEEADLIHHRRDLFTASERNRLAGVGHLARNQLLGAGLDGIGDPEQCERSLRWRRFLPFLERAGRSPHCPVDIGRTRQRRLGILLARGRVDDGRRPTVGRFDVFTVDEVLESLHPLEIADSPSDSRKIVRAAHHRCAILAP